MDATMISPGYAILMARYNAWQNGRLYEAAGRLSDDQRRQDRGAFFRSIHATLNHLIWADQTWLHRLAGTPVPAVSTIAQSVSLIPVWDEMCTERRRLDGAIRDWAEGLNADELTGDLTWYSGAAGRELTMPRAPLVVHFFNHQTHHRGQVHAMITSFGEKTGDTDLPLLPAGLW